MTKHWTIVTAALLAFLLPGCGEEPQTGPTGSDLASERAALAAQAAKAKGRKSAAATTKVETAEVEATEGDDTAFGALDGEYTYLRDGKRDPFAPYRLDAPVADDSDTGGPLEQFELEQLEIVALVWDASNPRAMVSDPSGTTYTVQVGSSMGKNDGRIIHIGDNLVLVKETYVDYAGEQTTKDVEIRVRRGQGG